MRELIIEGILWIFATYGLFGIIRTLYIYITNPKTKEKNKLIILVKNAEEEIEGVLRTIFLKNLFEYNNREIIISDLGSTDDTLEILYKLKKDYGNIKIVNCKNKKEKKSIDKE